MYIDFALYKVLLSRRLVARAKQNKNQESLYVYDITYIRVHKFLPHTHPQLIYRDLLTYMPAV